jgi:hypothetical protein
MPAQRSASVLQSGRNGRHGVSCLDGREMGETLDGPRLLGSNFSLKPSAITSSHGWGIHYKVFGDNCSIIKGLVERTKQKQIHK